MFNSEMANIVVYTVKVYRRCFLLGSQHLRMWRDRIGLLIFLEKESMQRDLTNELDLIDLNLNHKLDDTIERAF